MQATAVLTGVTAQAPSSPSDPAGWADVLTQIPLQGIGVVGLCLLITWAVMTGRLVPRSTVDAMTAEKDRRNAFLEALTTEQAEQMRELLPAARLSAALLDSVHSPNSHGGTADAPLAT